LAYAVWIVALYQRTEEIIRTLQQQSAPYQRTGEIIRLPSVVVPKLPKPGYVDPYKHVPTFGYPGGKAKLANQIVRILPPAGYRYVEPFAGRANVYFRVTQRLIYQRFWLNDRGTNKDGSENLDAFNFLCSLRNFTNIPSQLDQQLFDLIKQKHKAGMRMVDIPVPGTVTASGEVGATIAVSTDVLSPVINFSGGMPGKSGRSIRKKPRDPFKYQLNYRIANDIMRRTNVKITHLDFKQVLADCGPRDMVYL
jgi:hypothetical protein